MKRIEPNTEGYIITTFDWLDYCEIGMFTFGTILSLHYRAGEKVFENNDIVTSVFKIKRQTTSLAERMEARRVEKLIEKMKQIDYYRPQLK